MNEVSKGKEADKNKVLNPNYLAQGISCSQMKLNWKLITIFLVLGAFAIGTMMDCRITAPSSRRRALINSLKEVTTTNEAPAAKMTFQKLSPDHEKRLATQRALVLSAVRFRYGTDRFTGTTNDLPVLQRLLDDRVFTKEKTDELQAMGVVFGDVLATELGLHWELVTDEYGTDPVLRYETRPIQVAPLTMISKRVEDDKEIDLVDLLEGVRETLHDMKDSADYR